MLFQWDETKRLSNIALHGLDFIDVGLIFGAPRIVGDAKTVGGEHRKMVTGMIDDVQ